MLSSRFYRVFILAGLLSLFASYLVVWIGLIHDPAERTGADFIAFYSAGRVAQTNGFSKVYDPLLQQQVQEEEVGFPLAERQVLLYNHLPFLTPILRGLVSHNYVSSFYRWNLFLIVIYIIALLYLGRTLENFDVDKQTIRVMGIGSFLFLPLFVSLMNGQDTAILLLGIAIWVYGLFSGCELLSGLGLSLTTVRPHISLMLAIPMLFSYRRVFLGYVIGAAILTMVSILIVGVEGARDFVNLLLISAGGEWHGLKEEAMFNLIGFLTRVFPEIGAKNIRALGWIVYGVSIIGLSLLWARKRDLKARLIGTTIVIALFTAPHLHFHDLTLLLVPLYMFFRLDNIKKSTAMALPIAVSLMLLISNASVFLQYTTPYLIMLVLVYYTASDFKKNDSATIPHRS